ncbi:hypothetical protein L0337_19155 [candidate division KSB1 bacterium]|nr:hypothetical protein [candidate division KSB1 bacterium]
MPDLTQESSALSEILNRLKSMETKAEKFEAKVDKRFEMREGFRLATERRQAFQNKTEVNNSEIISIISDIEMMVYQKIDATQQELKAFQKSIVEALEIIRRSIEKKVEHLEREIEELKKDKAIKDAIIKRMEQRLTKLEAQDNPA